MDLQAYIIKDFVETFRISRSALYKLWTGGLRPTFYLAGKRHYVGTAAVKTWQRERERHQASLATALPFLARHVPPSAVCGRVSLRQINPVTTPCVETGPGRDSHD